MVVATAAANRPKCISGADETVMRARRLTVSKEAARASRGSRLPQIFGRGGRDRALICLAVNGPMTVRELGRAIGSDASKTFAMVERLLQAGLVVKRDRTGGRKYVAINKALVVYNELQALLLALDGDWPAKRVAQPRYRWAMWNDGGSLDAGRLDCMFQSPVRSRTLLFIAAVGKTQMKSIYDLLGLGTVSAMYAVNHWEREGVVRTATRGKLRVVQLNPSFAAAAPLAALLQALIDTSDEYRAYRTIMSKRKATLGIA